MPTKFNSLDLEAKAIYKFPDVTPGLEEEFEFDACSLSDNDSLLREAIEVLERIWDEGEYGEFDGDNVSVEITDYKNVHSGWANDSDVWEYAETWERFSYDQEILNAGLECGVSIDDIEEAYAGTFDNDEDFAQDLAEQLGAIDKDAKWPMNCIDWEFAAKELMYDYIEEKGHYFRNL